MSKLYDLLKTMCGKIKQPDWNQNDETAADYVKNRPFWTDDPVEIVLIPEMSITMGADSDSTTSWYDSSVALASDALETGKSYTVEWNGKTYECVGINTDGTTYLGNSDIWWYDNGYEDNGLPFVIYSWNGCVCIGTWASSEDEVYTFHVLTEDIEVHKIDEKYIPGMYVPLMVCTLTYDEGWVLDKTYQEIESAIASGKQVVVKDKTFSNKIFWCSLSSINYNDAVVRFIRFEGEANNNFNYTITVSAEHGISYMCYRTVTSSYFDMADEM